MVIMFIIHNHIIMDQVGRLRQDTEEHIMSTIDFNWTFFGPEERQIALGQTTINVIHTSCRNEIKQVLAWSY